MNREWHWQQKNLRTTILERNGRSNEKQRNKTMATAKQYQFSLIWSDEQTIPGCTCQILCCDVYGRHLRIVEMRTIWIPAVKSALTNWSLTMILVIVVNALKTLKYPATGNFYRGMTYCGWKKSCITLDGWDPIDNGTNHLSTGAGFRNHPPYFYIFLHKNG